MGSRSELAQRLAAFIVQHKLDQPYGGEVILSERRYQIGFCIPRLLDGVVLVYGQSFIIVRSSGPLARFGMDEIFAKEEHALAFLDAAYVRHDQNAADAVPRKAKQSKAD